jgi:hypothetical protein
LINWSDASGQITIFHPTPRPASLNDQVFTATGPIGYAIYLGIEFFIVGFLIWARYQIYKIEKKEPKFKKVEGE